MKTGLRRIAVAGNAVALALLAMVLANAEVLLGSSPSNPQPLTPSPPGGRGGKMLLVVVDALRNDSSLDPAVMPNLTRLAREGRRGTARVESWIPSTVAGIRSIVEGRVPPPASFLQDFGASRSRDGGIFAVLEASGRRSFAAGPRLWTDLYGPWLAGGTAEPAIGGDDGRLLRSGLDALAGGYDLVIVHLSGPDDAAHLHGGRSREYAAAVYRADEALGQLIARAGPGATVLVTSDHGVTAEGGHAGLDLRLAFRAATGPAGLPGAVAVVLLLQALPILLVILLAGPALVRSHPQRIGDLAAGLALALLGQGAVAALAIAFSWWAPLAVGLLVRLVGETTFLFLGGALVVWAAKGRVQGGFGD